MRIGDIVFGLTAAEEERARDPRLLLEGFLDAFGFVKQVKDGHEFLILGPKGSGKSAIASRIELLARQGNTLFASTYQLGQFPFDRFAEILPGGEAPLIKFPSNWELLLHILLVESLSKDAACRCEGTPSLAKVTEALKKLGLLPGKDLTQLVRHTSSRQLKLSIPQFFEFEAGSEKEQVPDVGFMFRILQDVCSRARPSGRHLVFVDGLDDVLTRRGRQYEALASLIVGADRMNRRLREAGANAKIVVLCRTDLFDLLPDPNKNKIKQDNAVVLDWYQDTRDYGSTNLVRLVNHRAQLSLHSSVDVFSQLLPGSVVGGQPTVKTILENTRHTPRDVIQLMNRVRDHSRGASANAPAVMSGLRKYSEDYLLPEMRDELCGIMPMADTEKALQLLSLQGKRQFTFDEFRSAQRNDPRFAQLDPMRTLEYLFECSAIGNVRGGEDDDDYRFSFKFRNRSAIFNPNERITVHRGICKALNLM